MSSGDQNRLMQAEISKMLSSIAGILLAGGFTFVFFVLEKSDPSSWFWILLSLATAAVVLSIVASGKGMDVSSKKWYRGQALLLGLGLLGFASLLPFSVPSKRSDPLLPLMEKSLAHQLSVETALLKTLESRIASLEKQALLEKNSAAAISKGCKRTPASP